MNQFASKHQGRDWEKEEKDLTLESAWIEKMMMECQDPKKADAIYRIMVCLSGERWQLQLLTVDVDGLG